MKELNKQIKKWKNSDIKDEWIAKLLDDVKAGDWVGVYWSNREYPDKGYIFVLPDQDGMDTCDACLHVPQMDNSDGMDDGDEIHIHLMEVLSNNRVEQIRKLNRSL